MSCYVGIDIGAVSAKAALLVDAADEPLLTGRGKFQLLCRRVGSEAAIYLAVYRRTRGKPLAAATELLEEVLSAVGQERIGGVCLTGSGSKLVAAKLAATVTNEFKAIAAGLAATGVNVRTVFEMGGESSKYLRLAASDGGYGVTDYATNGDCAAGTGSFLDQQAGRLRFAVEEIGPLVLSAERAAQVAGRCSVFAKSDMVHAQQKGYSPAEVLRGLCDAVARNFRAAVVRSHPVKPPVAFLGGVAANAAVVRALREAFGLAEGELAVPPGFAHIPAIGAAVIASQSQAGVSLNRMDDLRAASDSSHGTFPTSPPLDLSNVVLLRDRVEAYEPPYGEEKIDVFLGVDVGSVSTNVVAIDEEGRLVVDIYTRTQGRPIEVVSRALRDIEAQWGGRLNIRGVGTTGSGRELIGKLIGADTINDEITAHKTGATFVGRKMLGGKIPDTIFEIGGQDSKFISLQDGIVVDFTMNEACAAGTGSFLEERAEELDIAIENQFAELALSSRNPIRLGERCTVFMERDVNSFLQRGADKADLVAGLAYSVVYNYINRVVRGRKIGQCIFFQGGTAYNDAVAAAFAAVLGKEIIVPPHNGVIGAIGAALLARDKMEFDGRLPIDECQLKSNHREDVAADDNDEGKLLGTYISELRHAEENPQSSFAGQPASEDKLARRSLGEGGSAIHNPQSKSRFRGYDLSKVDYALREFTCKGCSNHCQIQEFKVEDEKTYWGDKCSDRYRKAAKATRKPVIEDLSAWRMKLLLDESHLPPAPPGAATVGIPLTMFAMEWLPFWRTLLAECGFATVLSEPTNKRTVQAGLDSSVSEPCFPIIAAHGHVAHLIDKGVDYILLPNIISMPTAWMDTESHLCPWHQTLPFVCRRAPALCAAAGKFLMPTVHFRQGPSMVKRELAECLKRLGVSYRKTERAVEAAYQAQKRFKAQVLSAGRRALETLTVTGEPGIVLLGRPYNVHDAGMNLSLAGKLRESYGVNVLPMDFLDTDFLDVRDINANMYWDLGRKILAAARIVGRHSNLHIIYVTNFKCGPDSFLRHFIRPTSGKPFLSLQFDGHSNDAGMMTRCEAYLDSKGILRPWRHEELAAQKA